MITNFLFIDNFRKNRNGISLEVILLLAMIINGLNRKIVYSKFFSTFTTADNGNLIRYFRLALSRL